MDRIADELGDIVESPVTYTLMATTRLRFPLAVIRRSALAGAVLVGLAAILISPGGSWLITTIAAWIVLSLVGLVVCLRSFLLVWGEDRLALVRWGTFTYRTLGVVLDVSRTSCHAEAVFPPSTLYPEFRLVTPGFTWRMGTSSRNSAAVERLIADLAAPDPP